MKKNFKYAILASALSSLSWPCLAQGNVNIYGLLDAGIRYSNGLGLSPVSSPTASSNDTTGVVNSYDTTSRFGLAGSEDLGDGLKAVFTLESDLYLTRGTNTPNIGTAKDTSATNAYKFFGRQAFVGLSGSLGKILVGRQENVMRDILFDIDAVGGRFNAFNPNIQYAALNSSGLVASTDTYYGTGNPGNDSMYRQDNVIKYVGQAGLLQGTAMYSAGGVSGNTKAGSSTGLSLKYGGKQGLQLASAYEEFNNNTALLKLKAYLLGAGYQFDSIRISATYGSNTADRSLATQIKTNIWSIGTTYNATQAVDLTLGYYKVNRSWSDSSHPDADIRRILGFAEYKFSPRSTGYIETDFNQWGGDPTQFQGGSANKSSSKGITFGLKHTF